MSHVMQAQPSAFIGTRIIGCCACMSLCICVAYLLQAILYRNMHAYTCKSTEMYHMAMVIKRWKWKWGTYWGGGLTDVGYVHTLSVRNLCVHAYIYIYIHTHIHTYMHTISGIQYSLLVWYVCMYVCIAFPALLLSNFTYTYANSVDLLHVSLCVRYIYLYTTGKYIVCRRTRTSMAVTLIVSLKMMPDAGMSPISLWSALASVIYVCMHVCVCMYACMCMASKKRSFSGLHYDCLLARWRSMIPCIFAVIIPLMFVCNT